MGDFARAVSAAVAHRRGWHRRRRRVAAAEQAREKVAAAVIGAAARIAASAAERTAPAKPGRFVWDGHDLAMRSIDFVLDRDIRHLTLRALEDRQQRPVAAVNVLAQFELARVINESGLISQVDRNEGRELDVVFA